ncbi:MAG: methyltransferase domain-containing protein [Cyanobacteriota bacterium]|nr:methyltransferase domain-containing protein [Cyanobacteriota bacterium]
MLKRSYPAVDTEAEFFARLDNYSSTPSTSLALDLGCGFTPRNPFGAAAVKGIDVVASPISEEVVCANLVLNPIPFEDRSCGFVTAHDFIEHVPRLLYVDGKILNPFILLMNEIYRVLAPGGLFYSKTPAYPYKQAFQDPTHVNIISEDTFPLYFCLNSVNPHPMAKAYGFQGCFQLAGQAWCGAKLLTLMRKTDPPICAFPGL